MNLGDLNFTRGTPERPNLEQRDDWEIRALSQAFGIGNQIADARAQTDLDLRKTNAKYGLEQAREVLLSSDRVNLDDERIPAEIRNDIVQNMEQGATDVEVNDEGTWVASSRVMKPAIEHFKSQIRAGGQGISSRVRDEYQAFLGDELGKFESEAMNEYARQELNTARKAAYGSAMRFADLGETADAIGAIESARNTGIFTEDMQTSAINEVVGVLSSRAIEDLNESARELSIASYRGDAEEVALLQQEFNDLQLHYQREGLLSTEAANAATRKFEKAAETEKYRGEIDRLYKAEGLGSVQATIDQLVSNPPPNWSMDETHKLVGTLHADMVRMNKDETRLKKVMGENIANQLEFQRGATLAGGVKTNGKEDEEAVNSYYSNSQADWLAQGGDVWVQKSHEMIVGSGFVPPALKDTMSTMLRSNPESAILASQLYEGIDEQSTIKSQIAGMDNKAFMSMLGDRIAAGTNPQDAYDAVNNILKVDTNVRKERGRRYNEDSGSFKQVNKRVEGVINDYYDQGFLPFTPNPNQTAAFASDYRMLEEQYFTLTDDLEQASKMAARDLQNVWNVSHVNGEDPQFMKLPPERLYPEYNGSSKWIPAQFNEYKDQDLADYIDLAGGAENIVIEADWRTQNSQPPSYAVMVIDPNSGVPYQATSYDDNKLLRWHPDLDQWGPYAQEREFEAQQQADMTTNMQFLNRQLYSAIDVMEQEAQAYMDEEGANSSQYMRDRLLQRSAPIMSEFLDELADSPEMQREVFGGRGKMARNVTDKEAMQRAKEAIAKAQKQVIDNVVKQYSLNKVEKTAPVPVDRRGRPVKSASNPLEVLGG